MVKMMISQLTKAGSKTTAETKRNVKILSCSLPHLLLNSTKILGCYIFKNVYTAPSIFCVNNIIHWFLNKYGAAIQPSNVLQNKNVQNGAETSKRHQRRLYRKDRFIL